MSAGISLIPFGMDESDVMMALFAIFFLLILVILLFITLPFFYTLLICVVSVLAILYGVYELRNQQAIEDEDEWSNLDEE